MLIRPRSLLTLTLAGALTLVVIGERPAAARLNGRALVHNTRALVHNARQRTGAMLRGLGTRLGQRGGHAERRGRLRRTFGAAMGRIGDRLVTLRGPQRSLARVEQLYERGDHRRALGVLKRVLRSRKLSDSDRARAFLYIGVNQTMLGNHFQAGRAFAGLAHLKPDFVLPANVSREIQGNFYYGKEVAYRGLVRGENFSAEQPFGKLSLYNRLRAAKENTKIKLGAFIFSRPRLTKLFAKTIGRYNVWRAKNTLELNGVPRFEVRLERDGKDPKSGARAHREGVAYMDYTATRSYSNTLQVLAHEAYHLNNPIGMSPQYTEAHNRAEDAWNKVQRLRHKGRQLSKKSVTGRKARSRIAGEIRQQRGTVRQAVKRLEGLRVREEGYAERFAGQVMARENLPLSIGVWRIMGQVEDKLHPPNIKTVGHFLRGARQGIKDYAGIDRSSASSTTR